MPSTNNYNFFWLNTSIRIDGICIYFEEFPINGLTFVGNLFESCGNKKLYFRKKKLFFGIYKNSMYKISV